MHLHVYARNDSEIANHVSYNTYKFNINLVKRLKTTKYFNNGWTIYYAMKKNSDY